MVEYRKTWCQGRRTLPTTRNKRNSAIEILLIVKVKMLNPWEIQVSVVACSVCSGVSVDECRPDPLCTATVIKIDEVVAVNCNNTIISTDSCIASGEDEV